MKVCVILTGGTIGSRIGRNTINVNEESSFALIEQYRMKYGQKEILFDIKVPFQVLSENFTPKQWEWICETLSDINWEQYDGIIITHGSDTLSYTCPLVGMLFAHIPIPIIFVASNYPLEDDRSNGLKNFESAVNFIRFSGLKGVYAIFQNNHKENIIYLGTRLMESDTYADQFVSYGQIPFGTIEREQIQLCEQGINPSKRDINRARESLLKGNIKFNNPILLLKSYPGLDYTYINLNRKPKAVLHYLYHSATGCTQGEQYDVMEFIKRCKEKEIPVYVASFKEKRQKNYVTANDILEAGGIPMYNISLESAYAKLWIAYNQKEMEPRDIINKNIFYEHLPKNNL